MRYQEEPHRAFALQPFRERTAPSKAASYELPGVDGALEGESLKILAKSGGITERQSGPWSRGAHLWWRGTKPGDTLDLAVPVAKARKYKLIVAHSAKESSFSAPHGQSFISRGGELSVWPRGTRSAWFPWRREKRG